MTALAPAMQVQELQCALAASAGMCVQLEAQLTSAEDTGRQLQVCAHIALCMSLYLPHGSYRFAVAG